MWNLGGRDRTVKHLALFVAIGKLGGSALARDDRVVPFLGSCAHLRKPRAAAPSLPGPAGARYAFGPIVLPERHSDGRLSTNRDRTPVTLKTSRPCHPRPSCPIDTAPSSPHRCVYPKSSSCVVQMTCTQGWSPGDRPSRSTLEEHLIETPSATSSAMCARLCSRCALDATYTKDKPERYPQHGVLRVMRRIRAASERYFNVQPLDLWLVPRRRWLAVMSARTVGLRPDPHIPSGKATTAPRARWRCQSRPA